MIRPPVSREKIKKNFSIRNIFIKECERNARKTRSATRKSRSGTERKFFFGEGENVCEVDGERESEQ